MEKPIVLVIDDEKNIREALRMGLNMDGFDVITAQDGEDGLNKFYTIGADAIILDLKMSKLSGMEFLKRIGSRVNDVPTIVLTGHGGVDEAVESMKRGAYDFLTKPPNLDKLSIILKRAIEEVRRRQRQAQLEEMIDQKYRFENIIGNSAPIRNVIEMIKQVAPTDATVLITGESGTGKELVASAIHANSRRKAGPFVRVHCAALTETLLESELFGHEKGAFTGAISRKRGRFELADGGTIFLDEIGEISSATQVKLLRVLQEHEFERVGGEETLKVDIRIIAATNRSLQDEVYAGRFREDLYYRLNVVNINVPRLRDRKEDIPLLANYFLKEFSQKYKKNVTSISSKAMKLLEQYEWKGNVRELQNVIENVVVLSSSQTIEAELLPATIRDYTGGGIVQFEAGIPLSEVERMAILATLDTVGWNKSKAARTLGIGRKTLLRKLNEYRLEAKE